MLVKKVRKKWWAADILTIFRRSIYIIYMIFMNGSRAIYCIENIGLYRYPNTDIWISDNNKPELFLHKSFWILHLYLECWSNRDQERHWLLKLCLWFVLCWSCCSMKSQHMTFLGRYLPGSKTLIIDWVCSHWTSIKALYDNMIIG